MIAYHNDLYVWQNPQQNMWITNGELFDGTSEHATKNPGILVEMVKYLVSGWRAQYHKK